MLSLSDMSDIQHLRTLTLTMYLCQRSQKIVILKSSHNIFQLKQHPLNRKISVMSEGENISFYFYTMLFMFFL